MAWQLLNITKANFDFTDFVPANTVGWSHSAYGEISRLQFLADDELGVLDLDEEDEIVFTDGGVKNFAGYLRQLRQTDEGRSTSRTFDCTCQDYTSALADDVIDVPFFSDPASSDSALIALLFSTFGTRGIVIGADVQTLRATMGVGIEFFGLNLHQAMTAIEKVVGASFYVDFDKKLHHYHSESTAAPFNLSDNPNYSTTFEYEEFVLPRDSIEMYNAVFVIGDGISGWRYKGGSPPAAGTRRAAVIRGDEWKTLAQINQAGDAFIAANSDPRQPGQLVTTRPGLRGGMTTQITHAGHGLVAVTHRIQNIEGKPESKDRVRYTVRFGSKPVTIGELFGRTVGEVNRVASVAAATAQRIADLSIAGGNLVPNSSFEDGTSWGVGAQWAIGVDPTPQVAYAGTKVARAILAAATAGNLATPFITVDRTDDYFVSMFRWIRSRTSGTFRIYVEEYTSGGALLATQQLNLTAVDTDWTRASWHFGPAASADVIAWQPTTAKIKIGFNSAGAAATLTVDVDAAQVERSKILTAYAPSPTDLLTAPITAVQIADDAITAPKIAANAVVAGKIAAGVITSLELASGSVTADKIAAGQVHVGHTMGGGNLVPNAGLEIDSGVTYAQGVAPPGWGPGGLVSGMLFGSNWRALTSTLGGRGGQKHLIHTQPNPVIADSADAQAVPVVGGRRYRWVYWIRGTGTNTASARARLNIRQYDGTGTLLSQTNVDATDVGASVVWQRKAGTFVTDPLAVFVNIRPNVSAVGAAGDIVRFDDFEFMSADQDTDHAAGNVRIDESGVHLVGNVLDITDQYGVQGVLTGKGFEKSWLRFIQTRLYNSDFAFGSASDMPAAIVGTASTQADYDASIDANLPHWIVKQSGSTLTIATDAAAPSGKCIQSVASSSVTSEILQDAPIVPGLHYRVLLTGKQSSGLGGITVRFSWRTATHAIIGSEQVASLHGGAFDTTYSQRAASTELTTLPAAPANAAYLRISIEFAHTGVGTFSLGSIFLQAHETLAAQIATVNNLLVDITLTTAAQDATNGLSVVVDRPSIIEVDAQFDFNVGTAGVGTCVGELNVDPPNAAAAMHGTQVLFGPATTGRATVAGKWRIDADAIGTWALKLSARKSINAGVATAQISGPHTYMRVEVKAK